MNADRKAIAAWCQETFGHENIVSATFGIGQFPQAVIRPSGGWRIDDVNSGVVKLLGLEGEPVSGIDIDPDGVTVHYSDRESERVPFDAEEAA